MMGMAQSIGTRILVPDVYAAPRTFTHGTIMPQGVLTDRSYNFCTLLPKLRHKLYSFLMHDGDKAPKGGRRTNASYIERSKALTLNSSYVKHMDLDTDMTDLLHEAAPL
jgi:hypothetical protein